MFPTLSHLIEYVFGIYIPLPVQTFGLFVGLAFLSAYYIFKRELIRKEQLGQINSIKQELTIGEPVNYFDVLMNALVGFIIGFKLIYALFHYRDFVEDPQALLLSTKGSLVGGISLGLLFAYWLYVDKKKHQLPEAITETNEVHPYELMGKILTWAAIWGLIGAKLFHNLEYWDTFVSNPIESLLSFSGLTFYGGIIFGGIAVIYYTKKMGIRPLHMLDIGAPGMMLGYAVGRLGCQLSGDGDWGIENLHTKPAALQWFPDWVWAFKFPHNVINEGVPIVGCSGRFCHELPIPVYPTSLYEFIACLILFLLLWGLRKRMRTAGMLFFIYLTLNGIERFFIELIRVNSKYHLFGLTFTQAELISITMIIVGLAGILYLKSKLNKSKYPIIQNYA
ncbi:prolipoprotein diacylglyceryl transferase [Olivibacter sp. XZL3]|uniref:prolipoprotein diacylglyceryl transferase n=1 Tax=Olivibacter sp. XZL3 TaxID=1735116 RepID=UPI001065C9EA|nr:prolipoprotein diacylglyceryl transferase [Olivibacter sp. XZL3]